MKQKQHYIIPFFGIVLCVFTFSVMLFAKKPTGFTLDKIRSPFERNPKWEVRELSAYEKEEVHKILSQEFHYLGSGAQCYAFLSEDGKYVLKFFKMKHLIPKNWLKFVPLPGIGKYKFNKIQNRILRHQDLFSSYKMAYEELKEETGMVYIHLNKSKDLKARVRLFDRMKNCYLANVDDYEFVVQKKAELLRDRITHLMGSGKKEEALEAIHSLLKQVVSQCKKGYFDRDSGISYNYGFVDDLVVHFDSGRIAKDASVKDPSYYQREVLRVGKKLEGWMSMYFPDLLPGLEEAINAMIDPSLQQPPFRG